MFVKLFLFYVALMNFIGFMVMRADKEKAKKHEWRIPEKTLFSISLLGGSLGTWIGMYVFHHKTKKWLFRIGIPVIFLGQILLIGWGTAFLIKIVYNV